MIAIDWTEMTASALSALGLTGALMYVLKRSFDKKLELLGEQLKDKMEADKTEARLLAEENTRRRAKSLRRAVRTSADDDRDLLPPSKRNT
jgi:hypothetical protein